MTATERDREVAAEIVRRGGYRVVDAIAAALAAERERALAPVLALADELEAEVEDLTLKPAWRPALTYAAGRIRRAAQDGES